MFGDCFKNARIGGLGQLVSRGIEISLPRLQRQRRVVAGNKSLAGASNKDHVVRDGLGLDGGKLANVGGADETGT